MKTIMFGLAIALAAPVSAFAAEAPTRDCCCKEMKEDCACCDKMGKKGEEHPDHKDMQH